MLPLLTSHAHFRAKKATPKHNGCSGNKLRKYIIMNKKKIAVAVLAMAGFMTTESTLAATTVQNGNLNVHATIGEGTCILATELQGGNIIDGGEVSATDISNISSWGVIKTLEPINMFVSNCPSSVTHLNMGITYDPELTGQALNGLLKNTGDGQGMSFQLLRNANDPSQAAVRNGEAVSFTVNQGSGSATLYPQLIGTLDLEHPIIAGSVRTSFNYDIVYD
jgi:type 1 fimbria pilin